MDLDWRSNQLSAIKGPYESVEVKTVGERSDVKPSQWQKNISISSFLIILIKFALVSQNLVTKIVDYWNKKSKGGG